MASQNSRCETRYRWLRAAGCSSWGSGIVPRLLVACVLIAWGGAVSAQFSDPELFSFDPDPPRENRSFALTVQVAPCLHSATFLSSDPLALEVIPGRIEVTLAYYPVYICDPASLVPYELRVEIDAVPAGEYELIVFGQDQFHPNDPGARRSIYSSSLTVIARSNAIPSPAIVPGASWLGLGALAIVLACSGLLVHRRLNS
jgi:hypothetical protein